MIDATQVLASQGRAAEGLLSVLLVTLQNFLLQISADWMRLIPPGEREKNILVSFSKRIQERCNSFIFFFLRSKLNNRSEENHFKVIKKGCF